MSAIMTSIIMPIEEKLDEFFDDLTARIRDFMIAIMAFLLHAAFWTATAAFVIVALRVMGVLS